MLFRKAETDQVLRRCFVVSTIERTHRNGRDLGAFGEPFAEFIITAFKADLVRYSREITGQEVGAFTGQDIKTKLCQTILHPCHRLAQQNSHHWRAVLRQ